MNHAYYNEIDPKAAAWLRELIKQGYIAPGEVDERSIEDVAPDDLRGFTQCHFFAGIGIWSYALRQAGWPDDKPIWTGSCPCQPFSSAGKGKGTDDERHLWPAFHWLIKQCRPDIILGEQVAQKAGAAWFDIVSTDLEGEGYSCGKIVFPACSVGAPHLRQRQYWVAHSSDIGTGDQSGQTGHEGRSSVDTRAKSIRQDHRKGGSSRNRSRGAVGELADEWRLVSFASDCTQSSGWEGTDEPGDICSICGLDYCDECECPGPTQDGYEYEDRTDGLYARRMADTASEGSQGHNRDGDDGDQSGRIDTEPTRPTRESGGVDAIGNPGPANGHWRAADWLYCRDGKWRPVEPGTFPLAHGTPQRVGLLRGYGNGIVAEQAKVFIEVVQGVITSEMNE